MNQHLQQINWSVKLHLGMGLALQNPNQYLCLVVSSEGSNCLKSNDNLVDRGGFDQSAKSSAVYSGAIVHGESLQTCCRSASHGTGGLGHFGTGLVCFSKPIQHQTYT